MTLTRPGQKLDVPLFDALNANRIRPNDGTLFFQKKKEFLQAGTSIVVGGCVCVGFFFQQQKRNKSFLSVCPLYPYLHLTLYRSFCNGLYVPIDPVQSKTKRAEKLIFEKKLPLLRQFSPPYCIHYTHTHIERPQNNTHSAKRGVCKS